MRLLPARSHGYLDMKDIPVAASAGGGFSGCGGCNDDQAGSGRAFLIGAADDGRVLGFASYDQFRAGNGYVHAMEHTVILAPEAHGRGLGRALMTAIEEHARIRGGHSMVAGVSGENAAGIAFHRALGYAHVGLLPQSGRKFGRWLDLVLMQKFLS